MCKKKFLKNVIYNRNSYIYWLLVGLVRSLKKLLLCEDYSDITSPISNQIPDIHIAVSVVYDI